MRASSLWAAGLILAGPALAQSWPDPGASRATDSITEQQREMRRMGEPSVPLQNRDSRQIDALGELAGSREWLKEAQTAIRRGQLGLANELLERTATRMLTRSTEPALAGQPMRDPRLGYVNDARQALFRRDRREADRLIEMAIQAP
ncbi:hypothetical protein [Sediminicoccus sp. BL-A-41-H5]|jgi:hypothetical protein|uniref:hypothetical protein n=1 Tax=Sediminicoccus sp. BL-A-41-H5 TaxID=3421106 RepID=UPI003D67FD09